jgi:hypothetical protein
MEQIQSEAWTSGSEERRSVEMEGEAQQVYSGPVGGSYNASTNRSAYMEGEVISNQIHVRPSQLNSDVNSHIGAEKGWSQRTE